MVEFKQRFCVISTHTLTWSVTIPDTMLPLKGNISTHTLTWSVTELTLALEYSNSNFNSHAHVERDGLDLHILDDMTISTHTLTWSVTPINKHECY